MGSAILEKLIFRRLVRVTERDYDFIVIVVYRVFYISLLTFLHKRSLKLPL